MSEKIKILLAEDEEALGMIVKESLETKDFLVTWATDGQSAEEKLQLQKFDVIVLDVMMPRKDGFTLAKQIRKADNNTPIIFLTSKSQTSDVVEGFELGGNDYLKKPFSIEELMVRIRELVNRNSKKSKLDTLKMGKYIFHVSKQTLTFENGEVQELTHRESQLLEVLAKDANELVEKSNILKNIWGNDDFFNGRSMDVFITKLRKKLSKDPNIQILNVRGYGYKLIV